MYCLSHDVIDFDKVKSLEDVKLILESINPSWDRAPEKIKHLTKHVSKETGEVIS